MPRIAAFPLGELAVELLGLLVPPICLGCSDETRRAVDALCARCEAGLARLDPGSSCRACCLPLPCRPCPAEGSPWIAAWAACAHDDTARAMVADLKQSGARRTADAMARELIAVLPDDAIRSAALVPVAPHPRRRRASGVDHAFELARALSRLSGRPVVEALGRVGRPVRQAGSIRSVRVEPGRIQFECRPRPPLRILLVDDVHTTGATLAAATAALLSAGAVEVSCATFTRALDRSHGRVAAAGW